MRIVHVRTPYFCIVTMSEFSITSVDFGELPEQHGPGVYTGRVCATLNGEPKAASPLWSFCRISRPESLRTHNYMP